MSCMQRVASHKQPTFFYAGNGVEPDWAALFPIPESQRLDDEQLFEDPLGPPFDERPAKRLR
jgi:hypothetical protein